MKRITLFLLNPPENQKQIISSLSIDQWGAAIHIILTGELPEESFGDFFPSTGLESLLFGGSVLGEDEILHIIPGGIRGAIQHGFEGIGDTDYNSLRFLSWGEVSDICEELKSFSPTYFGEIFNFELIKNSGVYLLRDEDELLVRETCEHLFSQIQDFYFGAYSCESAIIIEGGDF